MSYHRLTHGVDVEDAGPDRLAVHPVDGLVLSDVLGDQAEFGKLALLWRKPLADGRSIGDEEPRNNGDDHRDDSLDEEDEPPTPEPADVVNLEDTGGEKTANRACSWCADDVACLWRQEKSINTKAATAQRSREAPSPGSSQRPDSDSPDGIRAHPSGRSG